jgi:MFS transporter, DHA1 family, inner membrane transport protein
MATGDHPARALQRVLLLLAPAIAIVVASEFIVVGLLPLIARDLDVPLATAGRLTGMFALSAAVAGPLLTLATSPMSPRRVLIGSLLLFSIGNTMMVVVSDFSTLLAARIVQGAALPAFVSVGAAVVTQLASPSRRGKALAQANIGFVIGVLVALPAGVALAQSGNWRLPFLVLAIAPIPAAALVAWFFPAVQPDRPAIPAQLDLLKHRAFLGHLLLSVMLFATMFSAYTFLAAWLERSLALPIASVAIALFLFSAAGLIGNGLAARVADRMPVLATVLATLALVVSINLSALAGGMIAAVLVPLAIWSIAHTAAVTLSQVRVTMAGGKAPAFAMTMNISAANLGIALGSFAGGWVIDRQGLGAIGLAPVGFALIAVLLAILVGRESRRCTRAMPHPRQASSSGGLRGWKVAQSE